MVDLDNGLAEGFLAECSEKLGTLEQELLAIEHGGADVDDERIGRAFRVAHSVRGGAYFLDLAKIGELAHRTEETLGLIRSRKIVPTPEGVDVLLRATDRLRELVSDADTSNGADISDVMAALVALSADAPAPSGEKRPTRNHLTQAAPGAVLAAVPGAVAAAAPAATRGTGTPRMLLVEDDFTSRLVLQTFLSRYGDCHVAVNGREAVDAFRHASEQGQTYDLICMDIMMPEMDGPEAVRRIRAIEHARGILSARGAKITMTTTIGDMRKVFQCFKELCDAYLVKPIDLTKLLGLMKNWQLVP